MSYTGFTDAAFGISGEITAIAQTSTAEVTLSDTDLAALVTPEDQTLTFTGTDFEFNIVSKTVPLVGFSNNVKTAAEALVQAYANALDTIWHAYETSGAFYKASGTGISDALDGLLSALNTQYNLLLVDNLGDDPDPTTYVTPGTIGNLGSWSQSNVVASKSIAFTFNDTAKLLGLESGTASKTDLLVEADYPNIVNAIKDTAPGGEAGSGLSGEGKFDEFEAYIYTIPVTIELNDNPTPTTTITLDYTGLTNNQSDTVTVGSLAVTNSTTGLVFGANKTYPFSSTASRSIDFNTGAVGYSIASATGDFKVEIANDFSISDSDATVTTEVPNVSFDIAAVTYNGEGDSLGTLAHFTHDTEDSTSTQQTKTLSLEVGLEPAKRDTLLSANCLHYDPTAEV